MVIVSRTDAEYYANVIVMIITAILAMYTIYYINLYYEFTTIRDWQIIVIMPMTILFGLTRLEHKPNK